MVKDYWWLVAGIAAVVLLSAYANSEAEKDCRARGGQVIEQPGRINGCLRPARAR